MEPSRVSIESVLGVVMNNGWRALAACALWLAHGVVQAQTVEQYQELDCVINPSAIVEVSSAAPGVLSAVHADRSDRVDKDQLLAELESEVEHAELTLAKARAEIDTMVSLRKASLNTSLPL